MFDSLKLFYQLQRGLSDVDMGQQKFGGLFNFNQPYMRWTEDMFKMYQSGGWMGMGADGYWKFFTAYSDIFQKTVLEYPMATMNVYQRWYDSYYEKYNEAIEESRQERNVQTIQAQEKNYPADWDEEKEDLLIQSVIEGTKEAKTLASIFETIGEAIGISPARCSTYWYTKVDQSYRDQVNRIKQEQAKNWTEEEEEILTKIVTEEYPHLSIFQIFPIASKRLKRHKTDVQRKWFSLLTRN
ncbi:hypothetical protein R4Z09_29120 [Niallia oryzisoli]|uniref:Myb-like domain-containing protein n=1 Tax=Niallia oryzisoli TaxID=1737571 RepID=A0ABZ2CBU0_9BACI